MLKFASSDEALQHLSDLTGKKIIVAELKFDDYEEDQWRPIQNAAESIAEVMNGDVEEQSSMSPSYYVTLNVSKGKVVLTVDQSGVYLESGAELTERERNTIKGILRNSEIGPDREL